jgi:ABC-type transport system involved in multi-copper enzyme maturation permease subunit
VNHIITAVGLIVVVAVIVAARRSIFPASLHAFPTVYRVARMTVAEARRRKVMQVGFILAIGMLLSWRFLSYLSPGEKYKVVIDTGLATISFAGMLLTIFVGAFLIPTEVERRTAYAVLAKPVKRFEFVLGKYLGLLALVAALVVALSVVFALVLVLDPEIRTGGLNVKDLGWAIVLSYFALAIFGSLVLLVSTMTSTTMTVIVGFGLWIVGSLQSTMQNLANHAEGGQRVLINVIYTIMPKLESFDARWLVSNHVPIPPVPALLTIGGGLIYLAVVLILAVLIFNERQV